MVKVSLDSVSGNGIAIFNGAIHEHLKAIAYNKTAQSWSPSLLISRGYNSELNLFSLTVGVAANGEAMGVFTNINQLHAFSFPHIREGS